LLISKFANASGKYREPFNCVTWEVKVWKRCDPSEHLSLLTVLLVEQGIQSIEQILLVVSIVYFINSKTWCDRTAHVRPGGRCPAPQWGWGQGIRSSQ